MTDTENWTDAWKGVVDAVGQDFSDGIVITGADAIDASVLRRYVEPLEFDCPLHFDREIARQHGYSDAVAPVTSLWTMTTPPIWKPGGPAAYTKDTRDALPDRPAELQPGTGLEPPGWSVFATDFEAEYLLPMVLGDRLRRAGRRLVSCDLKATKVGRGAFTMWESEGVNQRDETVARFRQGLFFYHPHEKQAES